MRSDIAPAQQKGRFIAPQAGPKEMIDRPVKNSGQEQRQIDAPVPDIHIIRIAAEKKADSLTLGWVSRVLLYRCAGRRHGQIAVCLQCGDGVPKVQREAHQRALIVRCWIILTRAAADRYH